MNRKWDTSFITGDKRETAINIGCACSLLTPNMNVKTLDSENLAEDFNEAEKVNGQMALVITGTAIQDLLSEK